MTSLQPEGNWVGDETDLLSGYAESWRIDELDEIEDDDNEDHVWADEPA